MKNILLTVALSLMLASCAPPKFAIKQLSTSFSENKDLTYYSINNRISTKSIAGGSHMDDKGVFIDSSVTKRIKTGEVSLITINVVNKANFSSNYGGVNLLGNINTIVFKYPDGSLTTLNAKYQKNTSGDIASYNSVSKSASISKRESATMVISKEQYMKILSAKKLSVKITGTKNSVIYEPDDISPDFIKNLNQFYTTHIL